MKFRTQCAKDADPETPRAPRIGSVPYLNGVPLTCSLEAEVFFAPPSELAVRLEDGTLGAALLSVTETLLTGRYDLLDGIGIGSRGAVLSVIMAHRIPLAHVTEVACDPASLTSVRLLRVLFAERRQPIRLKRLDDYARAVEQDAVLLIGDRALDFYLAPHGHQIWDLGQAWWDLTGLPFVFAAWTLRRDGDCADLCRQLRAAAERGMATLETLMTGRREYDLAFRRKYMTQHLRFQIGPEEKRGIQRFGQLLEQHGIGRFHEPHFLAR